MNVVSVERFTKTYNALIPPRSHLSLFTPVMKLKVEPTKLIALLIEKINVIGWCLVTAYIGLILSVVAFNFMLTSTAQYLPVTAQLRLENSVTVNLEVARNEVEKFKGLRHRNILPINRGMLFAFSPPQPVIFTMEDVLVPLDIVYIKEGRILAISGNTPLCRAKICPVYPSKNPVDYVLEVSANLTHQLDLSSGKRIEIVFIPKN
jgi:uncharacterized protein